MSGAQDAPETPDTEWAPAKVNLYLRVVGRRADGYHLLDSLAVFAGVGDRLAFAPSDRLGLSLEGPFAAALTAEPDNLVLRAARALAATAGIPPRGALTLEKNIPVASGIGGGSADAAAALRLLCRAWRIVPDEADLDRIGAGLGADVPVCLRLRPQRMRGIGEVLTPSPRLPEAGLMLVNPGVPVSTPSVFRARTGAFSAEARLPETWDSATAMAADLATLGNDLEPPAIGLAPAIGAVLQAIAESPGCLLARMSGSGATCFGLFDSVAAAVTAGAGLRHPGWWVWAGDLPAGEAGAADARSSCLPRRESGPTQMRPTRHEWGVAKR